MCSDGGASQSADKELAMSHADGCNKTAHVLYLSESSALDRAKTILPTYFMIVPC